MSSKAAPVHAWHRSVRGTCRLLQPLLSFSLLVCELRSHGILMQNLSLGSARDHSPAKVTNMPQTQPRKSTVLFLSHCTTCGPRPALEGRRRTIRLRSSRTILGPHPVLHARGRAKLRTEKQAVRRARPTGGYPGVFQCVQNPEALRIVARCWPQRANFGFGCRLSSSHGSDAQISHLECGYMVVGALRGALTANRSCFCRVWAADSGRRRGEHDAQRPCLLCPQIRPWVWIQCAISS